jgi:hypothetical protein
MPERRRHPRLPVHITVELTVAGRTHEARLRDICQDAVFVETETTWPLETPVRMVMDLPRTGGPNEYEGRVVRVADASGDGPGVAILFTGIPSAARTALDLFLQRTDQ